NAARCQLRHTPPLYTPYYMASLPCRQATPCAVCGALLLLDILSCLWCQYTAQLLWGVSTAASAAGLPSREDRRLLLLLFCPPIPRLEPPPVPRVGVCKDT